MKSSRASWLQKSPFAPKGEGQHEKRLPDLFMRRAEVEALAKAISTDDSMYRDRFRPLFFIMANFGLRISEAKVLEKSDFRELSSSMFHVERLKKRRGQPNKGHHSRSMMDFVYVNARERELLEELIAELPSPKIFPYSVRMGQMLFGYYLRKAELRSVFTPHCLRRFVQVEMDELGIPDVVSKARIGHTLTTTELYKASPDRMLREIEKWKPIEV